MLTGLNQDILHLKEKLREYNKLESMKKSKIEELRKKEIEIRVLRSLLDKERKDVDKLEGWTTASIFASIMGNKYDKLDKEKEEYLLVKLKYEDAIESIENLKKEIEGLEASLSDHENSNNKYKNLIGKKEELIIKEGGNLGVELKKLNAIIDEIKVDKKEIREAVEAGERTLSSLKQVEKHLASAKSWGTWDILGGGFISDMAKHSAINDANKVAKDVQYNLNAFKKELTDVNEFTDIQVNLSSFASFADFFLDGIFADWFVQTKINTSLDNVSNTIEEIEGIREKLNKDLIKLNNIFEEKEAEFKRLLDLE